MRSPLARALAFSPMWLAAPLLDGEYRRLLFWSYRLAIRVRLLQYMLAIPAPLVTPGLLAFLHRHFATVQRDLRAWRQALRQRRLRT